MVLVDADAVVAQRVRVLELVHVLVVHAMTLDRVVQRLIDVDPHRTMLLPEVVGHVRPRHEVEPHELQGPLPSIVTPRVTSCLSSKRRRGTQQSCGGPGMKLLALLIEYATGTSFYIREKRRRHSGTHTRR